MAFIIYYNDFKIGGIRGYFRDFLIEDFVRVKVLEYRSIELFSNYLVDRYLVIFNIRDLYVYSLLSSIDN